MNYFDLFEMPVSFLPDQQLLKKKFYELSRKYHPDFFANGSEQEKQEILEISSQVNKAFKIFQDRDETIKYVLQLKGLLEEEEKYKLSNDFLMEMLELNEQLADAKMEADDAEISNVKSQIKNLQSEIYEPVKKNIEGYQEHLSSKEELLQIKEYYFRKKYLNRILAGLN